MRAARSTRAVDRDLSPDHIHDGIAAGIVAIPTGGVTCAIRRTFPFEPTSKRRKGYPSETRVKRGVRVVRGDKELF